MESHMQRSLSVLSAAALIAGLIGVTACQKSQALTPTVPTGGTVTPADGSTLKASAPLPQSPVGDARVDGSTALTLTAGSASLTYGGSAALQYRFQLLNDAGALVQLGVHLRVRQLRPLREVARKSRVRIAEPPLLLSSQHTLLR